MKVAISSYTVFFFKLFYWKHKGSLIKNRLQQVIKPGELEMTCQASELGSHVKIGGLISHLKDVTFINVMY